MILLFFETVLCFTLFFFLYFVLFLFCFVLFSGSILFVSYLYRLLTVSMHILLERVLSAIVLQFTTFNVCSKTIPKSCRTNSALSSEHSLFWRFNCYVNSHLFDVRLLVRSHIHTYIHACIYFPNGFWSNLMYCCSDDCDEMPNRIYNQTAEWAKWKRR